MVKRSGIIVFLCGLALLALTAYWLLFTTFMVYDDEGYVLVSLKNFSQGGGLYGRVFSQYGPFFYFIHDIGHRLFGYDFNNTNGRLFTLLTWVTSAGTAAHLVWRRTDSRTLTAFTLGLTFFHLRLMVSEPMHPGGMIAALLSIAAWGGGLLLERGAMRGLGVTIGLIGGALALTKINVGVFFFIAVGAWFATQFRPAAPARRLSLLWALLLILLPLGLMCAQWNDQSGQKFITLSAIASLTMLAVAWRDRQELAERDLAGWSATALVCLAFIVVISISLRGTGFHVLLEGIVLNPLRHPGVYHFAPNWKPGAAWIGGGSLLLALAIWNRRPTPWRGLLIGLRLVLVLGFCCACLEWTTFTSHSFTMSYVIPLAWIFALKLAPETEERRESGVTLWLGLILVLQYLHAYPVAGTQIAWGTFLIVPLMALGLHDTQLYVARYLRPLITASIKLGFFILATGAVGRLAFIGYTNYTQSNPLRLPGAEDVRLPEPIAGTLRLIALNATAHGDMLFSFPGMFSFNDWTDLPTPTFGNTTHWFSLLRPDQQADIIAAMEHSRRPVFVAQRKLLDFLEENHFPVASPLEEYLQHNFERAISLEGYELWVRRGRAIARIGSAEVFYVLDEKAGGSTGLLELIVAIPAGQRIASIELADLAAPQHVLTKWDQRGVPLQSIGLNLQGAAVHPEFRPAWNQPLPRVARLRLPVQSLELFDRARSVIYIRDAAGAILAEARFMD